MVSLGASAAAAADTAAALPFLAAAAGAADAPTPETVSAVAADSVAAATVEPPVPPAKLLLHRCGRLPYQMSIEDRVDVVGGKKKYRACARREEGGLN